MGLTAAIAIGTSYAAKKLIGEPPAVPAAPEPPKALTPEEKKKAEIEAVNRQRAQAQAAGGGRDNILTGPLGLVGNPALTRPTVLGG